MLHVIALCQTKLKKVSKLIVLKGIVLVWLKSFTWRCLVDKTINSLSISLLEVQNCLHVDCLQEGRFFSVCMRQTRKDEAEV